jgi:hypothetical protein
MIRIKKTTSDDAELEKLLDEMEPYERAPLKLRKDKIKLNLKTKKPNYKLKLTKRTDLYESIRKNPLYMLAKKKGWNKDSILCGNHGETVNINKVLFQCYLALKLSNAERQVFGWVLLHTTGNNVREVELNIYKMADDMECSRAHVYKGLNGLDHRNMVYITEKNEQRTIYINCMFDKWRKPFTKKDRLGEILGGYYSSLTDDM